MKTSRLFIIPLLLACSPFLGAVESEIKAGPPAGKPQKLSSPDQVPEGLAKSDWSSIRAAYEAGRHEFQPIEGGWQARNPGQHWTAKFDNRGFLTQPREGTWQWGLELKSYGFGKTHTTIGGKPAVKAEGQRLSYQWDASVQEWFVNDQRGLEHGFIIAKRPAATPDAQTSTLDFVLATRGTLRPSIAADAKGVLFKDDAGATVLNYTGLKVWDADGKILTTSFEASGETDIRLRVEESGAHYPLTIDPIAQQAYLKPGNNGGTSSDYLGYSVAVSGNTVVIGAPYEDSGTTEVNSTPNDNANDSGAAYVFVRTGTLWSQQAYLKAGNAGAGDLFGSSVAVSGDTVVVGAYSESSSTAGVNSTPDEGATNSGAAYVFVRSGTVWSQQAYLKASNTGADDYFGISVAVSGDIVVVGSPSESSSTTGVNGTSNENAAGSGAAYVFVRSGTTWSQQAFLKASNTGATDFFGTSVAVSGGTVVVGAHLEDSSTTGVNSTPNEGATNSGAAYIFVRNGTVWSQQAYLKAGNLGGVDDLFGISVAISGDTAVIGAFREDSSTTGVNSTPNESATNSGAVYVFVRIGTVWSQQAYLKAGNTGADDNFGVSVAVSGDTVVVGAYSESSSTTGVNSAPNEDAARSGAAYVFVRSETVWSQQAYLKAGNTGADDYFGVSVAIAGDTVIVAGYQEDSSTTGVNSTPDENATNSGAAYIYVRSGTTWSQQAYLKAGNTAVDDEFGYSVAVSGDTVVVGAHLEDSRSTGVNSTPDDGGSSLFNSGAAYVFVRNGTTWSQQAYLKAGNTGMNDNFGVSVAVSGDTVVVGADQEASSTTGVNSTPNESAIYSGAAYVFVRSGTAWSQQAYIKADNTGTGDHFGRSISVSGDTVAVGAFLEASSTTGVNSTPNEGAANSGAGYIFVRSGTVWSQQAYLKASNTGANDQFGYSVAVSGDTVVVGASGEDSTTTGVNSTPNDTGDPNFNSGAAYVFIRSGTAWSQQAYLKAGNNGMSDNFGSSVAVSGDTVVVGAFGEDSSTTGVNSTPNDTGGPNFNSGAAYVFVRSGTAWSQQAYLKADNTGILDQLGCSVAVAGERVVVGALGESSSTTGVNSTPDESAVNSGAAYVFVRSGTVWNQQAYLKAGNTGAGDWFGYAVAVSGDAVIVGALREDSSTTGVNNTPNEGTRNSGAAYIFTGLGPVPTLVGIAPAIGSSAGGTSVTLNGTDLIGATGVTFGVTSATSFTVNSATSITATTPAHVAGTVDVTVTTSGGTATGTNLFTYAVPDISLEAPTGTSVINGTGTLAYFSTAAGQTSDRIVTIRNAGVVDLSSISLSITGPDAGLFMPALPPPMLTLTAGASVSFAIHFSPTSAGKKTATLSITSNDPDESPFTLALTGTDKTPTEQWRFDFFGTAANTGNATDDADPDHDGLVNLLERAFNLNPTQAGAPILVPGTGTIGLPALTLGSGPVLRLEYIRLKPSANYGLTYNPQLTSDLTAPWQDFTSTETVESIDANWERVTIEEDASGKDKRFGRVKVSEAP